jgi:hypothetical protein
MFESMYSHSCEAVVGASHGFVDESAGDWSSRARQIEMHP